MTKISLVRPNECFASKWIIFPAKFSRQHLSVTSVKDQRKCKNSNNNFSNNINCSNNNNIICSNFSNNNSSSSNNLLNKIAWCNFYFYSSHSWTSWVILSPHLFLPISAFLCAKSRESDKIGETAKRSQIGLNHFFRWAIPCLHFVYFRSFQASIQFGNKYRCQIIPLSSGWDSNSRPRKHEFLLLSTAPGTDPVNLCYSNF